MFHFLFYHIRSSFAISYKVKKIRQRPTLPGDFFCLNPAQRAAEKILTKYNVGRWLENDLEEEPDGMHKEKPQTSSEAILCGIRQRPTPPGRLQPSTIGAERLNFCVRYGNRWIPFAIVTGKL